MTRHLIHAWKHRDGFLFYSTIPARPIGYGFWEGAVRLPYGFRYKASR
jgi:hypothetical protein